MSMAPWISPAWSKMGYVVVDMVICKLPWVRVCFSPTVMVPVRSVFITVLFSSDSSV